MSRWLVALTTLLLSSGMVACGEGDGPGASEARQVVAADDAPPGAAAATEVSPEQALRTDAEWYAAEYGTTVEEAERRLAAQTEASQQLYLLEQELPLSYGTSGVVHTPDFGFFVTTTDVASTTAATPREIGGYPVEVRQVSHSRADLEAALARIASAAGLEDDSYDVAVDAATTEITFFVADDGIANALEEAASSNGSPVDGEGVRFLLSDGITVRIERSDALSEPTSADG